MKAVCDWSDFLRTKDMGKFCLTVASQAMQTFRHKYLKAEILIDAHPDALAVSRAAYHGGRVECFRLGEYSGPLHLLDINSLYPHVMATEEFPTKLLAFAKRPSLEEADSFSRRYLITAQVNLRTTEPMIPVLEKGKLIFPVGQFDAFVTTPELRYLFDKQQVNRVELMAIYEKGRPFTEFVNELYAARLNARKQGRDVESEHYKLILNSFSGKWGQNGIKWVDVRHVDRFDIAFWPEVDAQTLEVVRYRRFDGLVQRKEVFAESVNSHPAIAAHITSYGRLMLWALIRQAAVENTLYCDTDAVLVFEDGFKRLKDRVDDVRLGHLKEVGRFRKAILYGPKDYILDGKRILKGVRSDALVLSPGTFRQTRWSSFKGLLRTGDVRFPRSQEVIKRLRRSYGKGIPITCGAVLPLHFERP